MPYRHRGISPALVAQLTGADEAGLPEHLTPSLLPGGYVRLVARMASRPDPGNVFRLRCRDCGQAGDYDLGLIAVDPDAVSRKAADPERPLADGFQATGYFRCKHCNGAGRWELPELFEMAVAARLLAGTLDGPDADPEAAGVMVGALTLFDGHRPQWATDAEAHLLGLLRERGPDAHLWSRLGNVYRAGRRPELAMAAFERAIQLDPAHVESHLCIGDILHAVGACPEAARHIRLGAVHAGHYHRLGEEALKDLLAGALAELVEMHAERPADIPLLPTPGSGATWDRRGPTASSSCAG